MENYTPPSRKIYTIINNRINVLSHSLLQSKLDQLNSKLAVLAPEKLSSTLSSLNAKNPFTKLTTLGNSPAWQDSCPVLAGSSVSLYCHLVTTDKNDDYIFKPILSQSENQHLYAIIFQALNKTISSSIILRIPNIAKKTNGQLLWR